MPGTQAGFQQTPALWFFLTNHEAERTGHGVKGPLVTFLNVVCDLFPHLEGGSSKDRYKDEMRK